MAARKIYAIVNYGDSYVQPLLIKALKSQLPADRLVFIDDISQCPSNSDRLLQWRQYEEIDFDDLMERPASSLANSYIIRKALIRKHYLANTISHWSAKHHATLLKDHVRPSVDFEIDYAEFLDDALVEAYELRESWERNAARDGTGSDEAKEWWILKPGMSERGQGIRLFSSEVELQEIFEQWDPPSDDEDNEEEDKDDGNASSHHGSAEEELQHHGTIISSDTGIMTSHLRHFVAQPYVHPPLLLSHPHASSGRKFHIRTYVLAVGALKVYVYKPMLALFAAEPYNAPSSSSDPNTNLSSHLTNTCLQSGERVGSVESFWALPSQITPSVETANPDWQDDVFHQICSVTGEIFEAAARSMSIHFQPLPNAFEVFGLDFLVDASGTAWLLEVNAFPDFAQTGGELQSLVQGLFDDVVKVAVAPFFGCPALRPGDDRVREVLNVDLGRR